MRLALAVAAMAALLLPWARDSGRLSAQQPAGGALPFSVVEASIADMRDAMAAGRTTAHDIVRQSLDRIATFEDRLNAVISLNPRALAEADALDRERRRGHLRGPLHGIPIALKDNIETADMPSTCGALAFAGLMTGRDATLTTHLRQAGAIIMAKTVLTELANWVTVGMPGNYSSLGGFGFNPYDPRPDPRRGLADGRPVLGTGGSSSPIGTAASFWAANVGTETSGSILSPSSQAMLVGIKPTVGRVSRHGVIPITADQDTPGPMARSVADAAIVLGVLEGTRPDRHDPATRTCTPPPRNDYTPFLKRGGLRGARIGIPRAYFYDPVATPGVRGTAGGISDPLQSIMTEAITVLRSEGATVVDPADIPSVVAADPARNFVQWGMCAGEPKGRDGECSVVFKYGMKRDFNAWLASLGRRAPVKSLTALREWNRAHESAGTLKYGQTLLDLSDEMDVRADRARYAADRAKDLRLTGAEGIDAALGSGKLDALLFPGPLGAALAARPGYPSVIVPFGLVPVSPAGMPDGFDPKPSPFGVTFTASACSEPRLIELAYAFEQATMRRMPPVLTRH
jgi:amidase